MKDANRKAMHAKDYWKGAKGKSVGEMMSEREQREHMKLVEHMKPAQNKAMFKKGRKAFGY